MSEDGRLHQVVVALFEHLQVQFTESDGEELIRLDIQGDNGYWMCLVHSREEQRQVLFYAICPVECGPERIGAMAELLARINYRLAIGCFGMDYDAGQIRLRTAVSLGEEDPEAAAIEEALEANVLIMDQYLPPIMAVIYSEASPAEALADH